jgi:hypothetical protein
VTTDVGEAQSDRGRFLRYVATTLGVGVGAVALPSVAKATDFQCCPDDSCSHTCVGQQDSPQRCYCEGYNYCLCFTESHCHSAPC